MAAQIVGMEIKLIWRLLYEYHYNHECSKRQSSQDAGLPAWFWRDLYFLLFPHVVARV